MVTKRHKVFLSYHHEADQEYADQLRRMYGPSKAIIDKSMYDDYSHLSNDTILKKIRREHLLDSTVTVVLVGEHTWGRKWIDWEINASLRPYGDRTVNGLVGVYLPKHRKKHFRLTDNLTSGFAVKLNWSDIDNHFINAVHQAWNNRRRPGLINNSRSLRQKNAPVPGMTIPIIDDDSSEWFTLDNDKASGQSSGCFIASVVFTSPDAREVVILRHWRDTQLRKSMVGRRLINLYYEVGPIAARSLIGRLILQRIIRRIFNAFIVIIA